MRDWLYVEDHVEGLMAVLEAGIPGETYLFGGRTDIRNIDLARRICGVLDALAPRPDGKSYASQIRFVLDRPGHDFRYSIDPSHAEDALNWRAGERLETGLPKTIQWYLDHRDYLLPGAVLGRLGSRTVDSLGVAS